MIEIESGLEIDGYTVGECVHAGAMGRIFKVKGPQADVVLAMKVPRMGKADSTELLLGFETEAMILPLLRTKHVPKFFAAGSITSAPYLVTEWVPGKSLDSRLGAPLPAEEVAEIGAAIADALRTVHTQGVIHFDLKPDNVVMRSDGTAVLVDFGLAHHRDLPDLLAEEMRYAAGSAPYISPEQVLGNRKDSRSDLFSLGVLLYELATARLPFGTPATLKGYRDRLWLDPKPPASRTEGIPPWLQEIILRCLEVDPDERYQSAGHVAFDLRHPHQVPLTMRARKSEQAGLMKQVGRWWRARNVLATTVTPEPDARGAPVIMVAVDTTHPEDPRHPVLQRATRQILSLSAEFRLVCISVISGSGLSVAPGEESEAVVEHRVRLAHWVQPLGLPAKRLSLHVLEALNPGEALLDFARRNNVDLIVVGAPGHEEMALAWWRSVASTVTANAPCSVHVVRVPAYLRE
jgi:nucleotide-binding universal stress UspA family protein